jgi:asparagine synthase (glutamine-hydrolysing)
MCRIAGILNSSLPISDLQKTVVTMCNLLRHGGPDDEGIFTAEEEHLVLGNRRLALMDLSSAGHQPMHYGNRYTITYNGELYNFKELKNLLLADGMQFNTHSDTEVILAAFAKWNTQSFSKLNGMFAFALWDKKEKKLYLVRDAAGIKPLYYSTHNGGICFASEIRGFAPISYLQEKEKNAAVYQLAYGFIPEPVTLLAHVKALPKGCFCLYNFNTKTTTLQAFNFFSFSNLITDEHTAKPLIYKNLQDAVHRQMLADEQVGIFLSGGIDSAIIAKLANQQTEKKLHTLSIYFEEEKYSEKKYQDIIAKEVNSIHHAILLKEADFHKNFASVIASMDMPTCDGINTWFISKFAAQEGLKAVLSGIGADELFGGYPSFKRIGKALLLQNLPYKLLQLSNKMDLKKYNRLSYLRLEGIRGIYLFLRGHFTPLQIAAQLGSYESDIWDILSGMPSSPKLKKLGAPTKASWMEFNIYMQDQLLRDADVMSMAHGLEIRVPFLDNKIIETAFSINEKVKFTSSVPKQLLINSCEKILPNSIWNRPKMGFSFPFNEWLKNSPFVKDLGNGENKETNKSVQDFLKGELHWSRIMSLLMLKYKI